MGTNALSAVPPRLGSLFLMKNPVGVATGRKKASLTHYRVQVSHYRYPFPW